MLTLWDEIRKLDVIPFAAYPSSDALRLEIDERDVEAFPLEIKLLELSRPVSAVGTIYEYTRLVKHVAPDVIHVNSLDTARLFSVPAWLHGVPLVCHVRFYATPEYVKWVFRGLPRPQTFVFNSHALREEMEQLFSVNARHSKLEVAYNAVDTKRFFLRPRNSCGPMRVSIVANLLPVKDHETFLRMARELHDRLGSEIEFLVIGGDIGGAGRLPTLRRFASELGIGSKVLFLGPRRDVDRLLAKVDVLVCSSTVEPFGRCLIEAMAVGRPVVATRVGGIPEVVTDGVTGFLVEPGDYVAMARAVERLLTNKDLWNKMAQAAARDVAVRFSANVHARKIRQIYENLLFGNSSISR